MLTLHQIFISLYPTHLARHRHTTDDTKSFRVIKSFSIWIVSNAIYNTQSELYPMQCTTLQTLIYLCPKHPDRQQPSTQPPNSPTPDPNSPAVLNSPTAVPNSPTTIHIHLQIGMNRHNHMCSLDPPTVHYIHAYMHAVKFMALSERIKENNKITSAHSKTWTTSCGYTTS